MSEAASGVADSGDPEQDLTDLLVEIGEVAQLTKSGALFLIDEMHNLDSPSLAAICVALQAISRRGLPVALVGAGLPDLQGSPHLSQAVRRPAAAIPRARTPTGSGGASCAHRPGFYSRCPLRRGRGTSGGARAGRLSLLHPGVRPRAVESRRSVAHRPWRSGTAREIVSDNLDRSFFGDSISDGDRRQQRYLAAMAAAGLPPYRVGEVATLYGARPAWRLDAPGRAIQKGLVWSARRGRVDLPVPRFAEYLRESHPLDSFEAE